MQTDFQVAGQGSRELAFQQNRVLRNTYMLLGLSMVPTVIGALVGIQMQFSFLAGSPFIAFIAASALRYCSASPSSWA
jgi:modulator of FtsH protease